MATIPQDVASGGAGFIRGLRADGYQGPIVADSASDGTYWLKAVPNLSNYWCADMVSWLGDDPNPQVQAWRTGYKQLTGQYPAKGQAVGGYVIGQLLRSAADRAKSLQTSALVNALNHFTNAPTAMGPTTYTPKIHIPVQRPMVIVGYRNGQPHYVTTINPGPVDVGIR
jgi:branched-chain amino acid transport system substrate-binding protein